MPLPGIPGRGTQRDRRRLHRTAPCYYLGSSNIVAIGAFKAYCGLWFHQGVFLSDPDAVLVDAKEGRTRGLRQWRFTDASEIDAARVRACVQEAIAKQRAATKATRSAKILPTIRAGLGLNDRYRN